MPNNRSKKPFSPTSDLVIKNLPNALTKMFTEMVEIEAEHRKISVEEVMWEIMEDRGRKLYQDAYDQIHRSELEHAEHRLGYAISRGLYTPPENT